MMKYLTTGFLLFFIHAAFGQSNHDLQKFIDSAATDVLKTSQLWSLSIGVIKDGKTQISYGDIGNGEKPVDHNYFEIASITKTFTGLLLALAVFDSKLNLEDDIQKYLDGDYSNLQYEGKPITFRQLVVSIYPENLVIDDFSVRTKRVNESISSICRPEVDFSESKNEDCPEISGQSSFGAQYCTILEPLYTWFDKTRQSFDSIFKQVGICVAQVSTN